MMDITKKTTRKNRIQQKIHEYECRRERLRAKHPNWKKGGHPDRAAYGAKVKRMRIKLLIWRRAIRRIEEREQRLWALQDQVCDFMQIPTLRHKGSDRQVVYCKARMLFCKYAIENGVKGWLLSEFLGTRASMPYDSRAYFTRSFKTNKAHYELWQRFKLYVRDLKEDGLLQAA